MNPRARLRQIADKCRQAILDGESWADNRPEEPPIDIEPFRVTLAQAERGLRAWDRGDRKGLQRLAEEWAEDVN